MGRELLNTKTSKPKFSPSETITSFNKKWDILVPKRDLILRPPNLL
jgi:hypothetical protein